MKCFRRNTGIILFALLMILGMNQMTFAKADSAFTGNFFLTVMKADLKVKIEKKVKHDRRGNHMPLPFASEIPLTQLVLLCGAAIAGVFNLNFYSYSIQ